MTDERLDILAKADAKKDLEWRQSQEYNDLRTILEVCDTFTSGEAAVKWIRMYIHKRMRDRK